MGNETGEQNRREVASVETRDPPLPLGIALTDIRGYRGAEEPRPAVALPSAWANAMHFAIDPVRIVMSDPEDVFTHQESQWSKRTRWRHATPLLGLGVLGVVHHFRVLQDEEIDAIRGILSFIAADRYARGASDSSLDVVGSVAKGQVRGSHAVIGPPTRPGDLGSIVVVRETSPFGFMLADLAPEGEAPKSIAGPFKANEVLEHWPVLLAPPGQNGATL